jgi:IcmF-related N-terminal domain
MDTIISLVYAVTYPIRLLYRWFQVLAPSAKWIPPLSRAMRVALIVLFFLLIVWTAAFLRNWWDDDQSGRDWFKYVGIALPFVIVIPVIVYWLVRIWMAPTESRFPDIDRVWQQGLAECQRNGVDLLNIPLFVVLGNPDHVRANHLVRASQLSFSVAVPDGGNPPISVFANPDSLFLFLDGCNCLSLLATGTTSAQAPAAASPIEPGMPSAPLATLDPFKARPAGGPAPDSEAGPRGGHTGTMVMPEGAGMGDYLDRLRAGAATNIAVPVASTVQLSSQDAYDRELRLRHVLRLVKKARQVLCPINGVLTLMPFERIETSGEQMQVAAQKDLQVLREETGVRCPNTVVITEMEKEDGFQELIKRVGQERCLENRFGKGCEVWTAPEQGRLAAVAAHASGAFEDWVYMLFQEPDALKHRGNARLFRLLGRVRGRFAENLRNVLARGFGYDPQSDGQLAAEQFLFGGCYFAAAGGRPGQQAFVKGVFQKMMQQEGELEWSPAARRVDRNYLFVANLMALLGAAGLVTIIVLLVLWYRQQPAT